jgi:hypothetical protein
MERICSRIEASPLKEWSPLEATGDSPPTNSLHSAACDCKGGCEFHEKSLKKFELSLLVTFELCLLCTISALYCGPPCTEPH